MEFNIPYPSEAFQVLEHLKPSLRISPFSSRCMSSVNRGSSDRGLVLAPNFWLDKGGDITFTKSGRDALAVVLGDIALTRNDDVLIITTSQGPYISSCVTDVIGSICGWSRKLNSHTRAILIIHEFGFPCAVPENILEIGLPVIEDCAYATGSRILGASVGSVGDYAIYSVPKYFPLPFGGIVASRGKVSSVIGRLQLSDNGVEFLKRNLVKMEAQCNEWNRVRRSNWFFFQNELESLGIEPYYDLQENISPGVFVFKLPVEYQRMGGELKTLCVSAGIEATEYYGQGGFYFPVHQYLSDFERQLICYQFKTGVMN